MPAMTMMAAPPARIIDLDPGMHSILVLEALGCCDTCPPIIVVTGLEELEMTAIAHRHGATACIGKPFKRCQPCVSDAGSLPPPTRDRVRRAIAAVIRTIVQASVVTSGSMRKLDR